MTFSNILLGLTIGFPMMIAVGPISVLLLDLGLERGIRRAAPAVIGVASADLTLSIAASIGGSRLSELLAPITGWLTLGAVAVLTWLAFDLGRASLVDLRGVRVATADVAMAPAGAAVETTSYEFVSDTAAADERVGSGSVVVDDRPDDRLANRPDGPSGSTFGHLAGVRLAAAFYGLTLVNPLTLVLFASLVVAGGNGIGTMGWAVGMALASLVAHGAFMVTGGVLGTRLSPTANGVLRLIAAAFMAALAIHFAAGI